MSRAWRRGTSAHRPVADPCAKLLSLGPLRYFRPGRSYSGSARGADAVPVDEGARPSVREISMNDGMVNGQENAELDADFMRSDNIAYVNDAMLVDEKGQKLSI